MSLIIINLRKVCANVKLVYNWLSKYPSKFQVYLIFPLLYVILSFILSVINISGKREQETESVVI